MFYRLCCISHNHLRKECIKKERDREKRERERERERRIEGRGGEREEDTQSVIDKRIDKKYM